MYLAAVAVLTLLLMAWHFSIQAAAHDAAIVQVRAWLTSMNATAGTVQFRLLRGALTIENIKANMHGSPISIKTLFIQGNPASITTSKPLLQRIDIQGLTLNASQMDLAELERIAHLPNSLDAIFKHAKHMTLTDSKLINLAQHNQINITILNMTGNTENREIYGQGAFVRANQIQTGTWYLESFIPQDTAQQSGKIIAESPMFNTDIYWQGAWKHENMTINVQASGSSLDANLQVALHQDQQQWKGTLQSESWAMSYAGAESLVTGSANVIGTLSSWQLSSDKLLWQETTMPSHHAFIQDMTSHGLHINSSEKSIRIQRMDITDSNIAISTSQPLPQPDWQWNIASINIQDLYIALAKAEESISLPSMHGTASFHDSMLALDISQHADAQQFWRIRSRKGNTFHISASHVPLISLRNILPEPIRSQSYEMEGAVGLELSVSPSNTWETSGKVSVSNLKLASKNQRFLANTLRLQIHQANLDGVQQSELHIENWMMQFPLTPRQAWSNTSHLDEWAKVPWLFKHIYMRNGQVVIGKQENIWLDHTNISIENWRTKNPTSITLSADMGLAPMVATMTLTQVPEKNIRWQSIELDFNHANMFFLEDWLRISEMPRVSQGHFSVSLSAQRDEENIQGHVDLKLHRVHLLHEPSSTFLGNVLNNSVPDLPTNIHHLQASFSGNGDWSGLAAQALLKVAKEKISQNNDGASQSKATETRLGSLRIQHDIRLSLNERTRLRRIIKTIKQHNHAMITLTPNLGTAELTSELRHKVMQTQTVIKQFMSKRGIKHHNIYAVLPQEKHQSRSDISSVHINLIQ